MLVPIVPRVYLPPLKAHKLGLNAFIKAAAGYVLGKACFSVYREIWYSPHLSSNVARRYSAPLAGFESIMRAGQADDSLFAASLRLSLITSILREHLVYKPYCSIKTAHCVQIICLHKLLIKCLTSYIDERGESGYHYVKQMINAICRGGIVYEKEDSAC